MEHLSNRWKAGLAWIASMSVVWTLFVPHAVSRMELASVSVVGLVVLVISARWAKDESVRSIGQILQDIEGESGDAPAQARMSTGPRSGQRRKGMPGSTHFASKETP
jgi:hypothetical protein